MHALASSVLSPPPRSEPRTGARLVVEALEREGVRHVFGYPGGAIMPVYDALPGSSLTHILVRHEQAAALAADAYGRVTGRPGVCLATSGPGATNLVTGIANAFLDSVPLVAITGQVAAPLMGTDAFQEVDIFGITLPIVKHSYLIRRTEDIPAVFAEAFALAQSGRPGPVLIDLPKDMGQKAVHVTGNFEPPAVAGVPALMYLMQDSLLFFPQPLMGPPPASRADRPVADLAFEEHSGAILLNAASGPVLGQMFLGACSGRAIRATLVLVGSPAAGKDVPGMAHYCAGKDAMHHWARIAALEVSEGDTRVVTVVPYAVLTDVVRNVMAKDPSEVPLVEYFRQVEQAGEFATPEETAEQIWATVESAPNGAVVPVGSLVVAHRAAAAAVGAA